MTDWDDYRFAAAVAQAGTVRGAADLLGVHPSTVTRRIDHFEQRLGIKLFVRSVRGLVPTAEGRRVVGALDNISKVLQRLETALVRGAREIAGELKLSVSPVLTPELFLPALKELTDAHSALSVSVSPHWTAAPLQRREADVSLLVLRQAPDELVGRSVGAISFSARAQAEVAARWPDHCSWLPSALQQAIAPDLVVPAAQSGGSLESVELQLAATGAGLGATLLPTYRALQVSGLVELALPCPTAEVWVLSHPDARGMASTQALAGALADAMRGVELDVG